MGEPQLERRRAVLLDRSHLRLGGATNSSFAFQLFHTSRPGTLDTSLVSTDNINNPRTMNAVYCSGRAHGAAPKRWGKETLAGGGLNNKQFNDYVHGRPADAVLRAARHGLDAARAEGRLRLGRRARRAESRLPQHRHCSARSGCCTSTRWSAASRSRRSRSPSRSKNSAYWQATELQTPDMALFFLKTHGAAPSEGRARRRRVPDQGQSQARRAARSCSPSAARAAIPASCRPPRPASIPAAAPARTTWTAGTGTGPGPRPTTSSSKMRADRPAPTTSSTTTTSRPSCAFPSRCCRPTPAARSRPTRIARQHLGQLLVADLQGSAVGRHDHRAPPVHRRAAHLHDAGRRPRLHASGVARSACGRPRRSC